MVEVGTKVICRMCAEPTVVIRLAALNSQRVRYELKCGHTNTLRPWEVVRLGEKRGREA